MCHEKGRGANPLGSSFVIAAFAIAARMIEYEHNSQSPDQTPRSLRLHHTTHAEVREHFLIGILPQQRDPRFHA